MIFVENSRAAKKRKERESQQEGNNDVVLVTTSSSSEPTYCIDANTWIADSGATLPATNSLQGMFDLEACKDKESLIWHALIFAIVLQKIL